MEKAYLNVFLADVTDDFKNGMWKGGWVILGRDFELNSALKRFNISGENFYITDYLTNLSIKAKGFLSAGEILNLCKLVDFINQNNISIERVNAILEKNDLHIEEITEFLKKN